MKSGFNYLKFTYSRKSLSDKTVHAEEKGRRQWLLFYMYRRLLVDEEANVGKFFSIMLTAKLGKWGLTKQILYDTKVASYRLRSQTPTHLDECYSHDT